MRTPDFLPIEFIIVGGSICGLSAAIALRRAGHKVTVFDHCDPFVPNPFQAGCRLPPNSTKIYYRWGMEQRLRDASVKSTGNLFATYDSGRLIGEHDWEEEVLTETGGDFMLMHFTDLRRILAECAIEHGATIRASCRVTSVKPDRHRPSVTLETGEVLECDVIIGADGSGCPGWLCRTAVLEALGDKEMCEGTGLQLFNVIVPEDKIQDKELVAQLRRTGKVYTWFGPDYGALGYPVKAPKTRDPLFTLFVYGPLDDDKSGVWQASSEELLGAIKNADPRLTELAKQASNIVCIPMVKRNSLDEWVHPDGRLLVIGEGAHPLIMGSIYALGMSTGDAAVLGRIFSHLHRKEQIDSFLSAVQEIRKKRVEEVMNKSAGNIFAVSIPPAIAATHDRGLHMRAEKGLKTLLKGEIQPQSSEQMVQAVQSIFAYDPEDAADDWWVEWGVVQERAARWNLSDSVRANPGDEAEKAAFGIAQQVTVVSSEAAQ